MKKEIFDVIVIGSGFAGLRAAIKAAESGAKVLVLEKMKTLGGNSVISDGGMAAAGTSFQTTLGIEDSALLMKEDILKSGGKESDPILVETLSTHALAAFDWAKDVLKVPFRDDVELFGGHAKPRSHSPQGPPSGRPFIVRMEALCHNLDIDIRKAHYVSDFYYEDGDLAGVKCKAPYRFNQPLPTTESLFIANKGIVIATGGFSADVAFRKRYDTRLDETIDTTNKPSATAEILRLAEKAGAQFKGMDHIQLAPWTSPEEHGFGDGPLFADYIALPKGILINTKTAQRFVNELSDRRKVAEAILIQNYPVIAIADQTALDQSPRDIKKALEKNVVRRYDDLASLAKGEKITNAAFLKTIERFNGFVKEGRDLDFVKPISDQTTPIATPPFYAMRIQPKTHHTMGGLKIDAKARVLDQHNQPIKKLYAAGEAAGGIHGQSRLGSMAITDCLVFGAIAGESAAFEAS